MSRRAEHSHDPALRQLATEITSYVPLPDVSPAVTGPVLTLEMDVGPQVLRFFTVASQLETVYDSTLDGLHLETFLPADAATAAALRGG